MNIVGNDFSVVGQYNYQSEWITVTNTSSSTQTYTFMYSYNNLPTGWYMMVTDHQSCFAPNFSIPIEIPAGEAHQFKITIYVESTGGFDFSLTFDDGDLSEPVILNFDFNTEDNLIYADFIGSPTSGYNSIEVQFTDLSTPAQYPIINWYWDFENDGTYDSIIQNPNFTYTEPGVYSVKLKVDDGINVDSLVQNNYITVEYVPPAPPSDVQVNIIHPDAIISWTEVDTTIFGDPITPDGYIVLYSENDVDYFYLYSTVNLTYTHIRVAEHRDQMFYKVVAFINYSRVQTEYLESLNSSREKLKWTVVEQNLDSKK